MNQFMPFMVIFALDVTWVLRSPAYHLGVDPIIDTFNQFPLDEHGFGEVFEDGGRDGDVAWVRLIDYPRESSYDPSDMQPWPIPQPRYEYRWAERGSRWMFAASAPTREALDALMVAFVEADNGSVPATPIPTTSNRNETCVF